MAEKPLNNISLEHSYPPMNDCQSAKTSANHARRRSSLEASEYNFSRRTSLYNITNGSKSSFKSKNHTSNGSFQVSGAPVAGYHGRHRNSILLEELSQFEHEIWDTLPEQVEEADDCEYEEHDSEKSTPASSPYKIGKAQFYSCQRAPHTAQPSDQGQTAQSNGVNRKGSFRRGSLNAIPTNGLSKWVKSGFFNSSNDEPDDKYFLVKSGNLEQLVEQCLLPHRKLDDPFFKDILLEQHSMFTDKVTLANQLLQSAKCLLSLVPKPASWKKISAAELETSVKENAKIMITKWKDDFQVDFQDAEGLKLLEKLIHLSVLINSVHLKHSLERQKRLLDVKVRCFIDENVSKSEEVLINEKAVDVDETSLATCQFPSLRSSSSKSILPNKLQLPFPAAKKFSPGKQSLDPAVTFGQMPEARKVQTFTNRPKKRPLLRSLSNSSDIKAADKQLTQQMGRHHLAHGTPETTRKHFCPFSPEEVAQQLTFKYSNYLLEMRPFEIVQYAEHKLDTSNSSLHSIIALNKELEEKIPSTILADVLLKSNKIASVIEFWLKVAGELRELRNYECLQIVVHSLNSPMYDSSRLPEVWSHVDKLQMLVFERLKETVSIEDNYQILRELQKKEESEENGLNGKPKDQQKSYKAAFKETLVRTLSRRRESKECIEKHGFVPCINVIKKDILGILAAHKIEEDNSEVIAFAKHRKIHQQLQQIRLAQRLLKRSLQLQHNEQIWSWFQNIRVLEKSQRDANSSVLSRR